MTIDEFWDHIRATRRVDPDEHDKQLVKRLAKLPLDQIFDFDHWWQVALNEAYRRDLWGAAYLINGGCSDDGFDYFRRWLILQGHKVFQAAIANPDSLADVVDPDEEFIECECHPAWDAWFAVTRTKQDEAGYDALLATLKARDSKPVKARRIGRLWDFDDDRKMQKRFPRLAKMYLDRG